MEFPQPHTFKLVKILVLSMSKVAIYLTYKCYFFLGKIWEVGKSIWNRDNPRVFQTLQVPRQ